MDKSGWETPRVHNAHLREQSGEKDLSTKFGVWFGNVPYYILYSLPNLMTYFGTNVDFFLMDGP